MNLTNLRASRRCGDFRPRRSVEEHHEPGDLRGRRVHVVTGNIDVARIEPPNLPDQCAVRVERGGLRERLLDPARSVIVPHDTLADLPTDEIFIRLPVPPNTSKVQRGGRRNVLHPDSRDFVVQDATRRAVPCDPDARVVHAPDSTRVHRIVEVFRRGIDLFLHPGRSVVVRDGTVARCADRGVDVRQARPPDSAEGLDVVLPRRGRELEVVKPLVHRPRRIVAFERPVSDRSRIRGAGIDDARVGRAGIDDRRICRIGAGVCRRDVGVGAAGIHDRGVRGARVDRRDVRIRRTGIDDRRVGRTRIDRRYERVRDDDIRERRVGRTRIDRRNEGVRRHRIRRAGIDIRVDRSIRGDARVDVGILLRTARRRQDARRRVRICIRDDRFGRPTVVRIRRQRLTRGGGRAADGERDEKHDRDEPGLGGPALKKPSSHGAPRYCN